MTVLMDGDHAGGGKGASVVKPWIVRLRGGGGGGRPRRAAGDAGGKHSAPLAAAAARTS